MSIIHQIEVVLCKGLSEKNDSQEEYINCLEAAGYSCKILPTLSFKFINIEHLKERIRKADTYSGFILTSPRAIEAIDCATRELDDNWRKLPGYCVGPTTELLAKNCLRLENTFGAESGNARDLAEYILQVESVDKPLLYPCSAISRDTIQQTLERGGVVIDQLVVYETCRAENLRDDLLRIVSGTPQIYVFFSPSIVKYVIDTVGQCSLPVTNIKSVAIGPVTAEAISKFGLPVYATAAKPEPRALLEGIKTIEIKR